MHACAEGAGGWVGGLGSCCCYSTTFTVPGVFVMQLGMSVQLNLGMASSRDTLSKSNPRAHTVTATRSQTYSAPCTSKLQISVCRVEMTIRCVSGVFRHKELWWAWESRTKASTSLESPQMPVTGLGSQDTSVSCFTIVVLEIAAKNIADIGSK